MSSDARDPGVDSRPVGPPARSHRARTAALLFLAAVALYTSTGPAFSNADTVPARYMPISIVRDGDFNLDEFTFLHDDAARTTWASPEGHPYFLTVVRGHWVSRYSPGAAVLSVPVYALPVLAGLSATSPRIWIVERLAAATLIALSAVFMFLALCEWTSDRKALLIAILYAFGTGNFSMTSQILWEQTATQFLVAAAVLGVVRSERDASYLWWAGAALGAATVVRPPDLLLTAPMALYLLVRHRLGFVRVAVGGLVPAVGWAAYNLANLGALTGSDRASATFAAYVWAIPYFLGLYSMLLSASRGLFVFSPFLLFAIPGIVYAWRRGPSLVRYLSVGVFLLASLYGKYIFWDAGWGYGPRFLLDTIPLLCMALPAALDWVWPRRAWRAAFLTVGVVSIGINALGAYLYDPAWEGQAPTMAANYERMRSWKSSQILHHARRAYRGVASLGARWDARYTSANAPQRLGARYEADLQPRTVRAGDTLEVPVLASNTGQATWLDRPERYYGAVRLAWSWHRDGREVGPVQQREDLPNVVAPGATHRFAGKMPAPQEPGEYMLRVGLVSELVVFFHDQGVPALEIAVHVTPR